MTDLILPNEVILHILSFITVNLHHIMIYRRISPAFLAAIDKHLKRWMPMIKEHFITELDYDERDPFWLGFLQFSLLWNIPDTDECNAILDLHIRNVLETSELVDQIDRVAFHLVERQEYFGKLLLDPEVSAQFPVVYCDLERFESFRQSLLSFIYRKLHTDEVYNLLTLLDRSDIIPIANINRISELSVIYQLTCIPLESECPCRNRLLHAFCYTNELFCRTETRLEQFMFIRASYLVPFVFISLALDGVVFLVSVRLLEHVQPECKVPTRLNLLSFVFLILCGFQPTWPLLVYLDTLISKKFFQ